jgi:enoyl-CoA hydratase
MSYDDYKTILFERQGRILTVTMNRPEKLNAMDAVMHEELSRVFYDVATDADADVIVLTGAGRAFSAGGDIDWMQEMIDDAAVWERTRVEAKKIVFGLLDCEKPIIASINGPAMGLGATIALFCDVIFAGQSAIIADPHVSVGLVAGDGGAIIWPQLVGYARAKEYLMTGAQLSPQEAERIGLINHAVADEELAARVQAFAERLARGATQAIRYTKATVNIGLKQLAHTIMDASIAYESLTNFTADHQEAVSAFREKRRPSFTGG